MSWCCVKESNKSSKRPCSWGREWEGYICREGWSRRWERGWGERAQRRRWWRMSCWERRKRGGGGWGGEQEECTMWNHRQSWLWLAQQANLEKDFYFSIFSISLLGTAGNPEIDDYVYSVNCTWLGHRFKLQSILHYLGLHTKTLILRWSKTLCTFYVLLQSNIREDGSQKALEISTKFANGKDFQPSLQHFQVLSGTCGEMRFGGNFVESQKFVKLRVSAN